MFVFVTGIDLSDFPAGESVDNPLERSIQENIIRNEDINIPPSRGEYRTNSAHRNSSQTTNALSVRHRGSNDAQYKSWNTLR